MKSGSVAVIGRANAGKSTLINVLVGEKVSIVSPKPQTTRERILGILNEKDFQIVFVDTPGIYKAESLLNSYMQRSIESAKEDVDVVLFVLDAHEGLGEKDKNLVKKFSSLSIPTIIVLSKIDITPESLLVAEIKELGEICENIVPISARKGKNLKELKKVIVSLLPEGERLFSDDIISDRSEKFMIKEIMREKILLKFQAEIPHGVAIIVNQFSLRDNGEIYDINLDIVCEKPNHKAILIGKNGSAIREVSSFARQEMEKFLGKKVFLTTYVKVEENWRDSAYLLKEHGYTEEN